MKKFNVIILFGMITLSFLFFSPPSTNFALASAQGSSEDILLIGTTSFGLDLDPQNAWDTPSFNIIHQVSEGLYSYDLGDKYLREVPRLAADCGTWSEDYLEFTVALRENITFHNGHEFNANAVKASFDRLNYLVDTGILQTAELYKPLNGGLVINRTEVIDEFTVKFVLNYQFVPFVHLLCSTSSRIVDASVMPADDIILPNETLIGTGPYKFMGNDGEKVEFEYYADYYRGVPAVKNFTYIKYENTTAISTALLTGDVHMGDYDPDFIISSMDSDILTVEEPKPGSILTYMGMNNIEINKTIRQAISYGMDYEYIINSIFRNLIVRMTTVVPPGIPFHIPQEVATYDVDAARAILIAEGLSQGLDADSEDSEWIAIAESGTPIAHYNYTYNLGNVIREEIGIETQYDLSLIGISVELSGVTWVEFLTKLHFNHNELQLFLSEWMPDYNDPSNYINPLFSNTSMSNSAQVDDPWLQEKMMVGLTEFNQTARHYLYYDIQEYIATDLIPWVFIGFNNGVSVHSTNVTDLQRNPMGCFYVFPLTWYGDKATWDAEEYCPNIIPWDSYTTNPEKYHINFFVIIAFIGVGMAIIVILAIYSSSALKYR